MGLLHVLDEPLLVCRDISILWNVQVRDLKILERTRLLDFGVPGLWILVGLQNINTWLLEIAIRVDPINTGDRWKWSIVW